MDIFLAALDKTGPWMVVVLLIYFLWDRDRRQDKGIRESLTAVVAGLDRVRDALDAFTLAFGPHDRRAEEIAKDVARLTASMQSLTEHLGRRGVR